MGVDALYDVSVREVPATSALRLVEAKVALEVGAVGVAPLACDELTILESSDVLLACLFEDVGALAVFLSISPVAGVDVFIEVGHDALAVPLTVLPVPVVFADLRVHLLSDSVLAVVNPGALVLDGFLIGALGGVGVVSLAVAFLKESSFSYCSSRFRLFYLPHRGSRQRRCLHWGSWLSHAQ